MAILKIAKMGHPVLLKKAKKVKDPTSLKIRTLVNDMLETLHDLGGSGVGLAAPQVHVSLQVVIFEIPGENNDYKSPKLISLVNPNIEILTKNTETDWEGCLSCPGAHVRVRRSHSITLEYQNEKGKVIKQKFKGFDARVIQHELDHLNGFLILDRGKVYQE